MYLVNDKDHVALCLYVGEQAEHPRLKLSAELRTGDQCGEVDEVDGGVFQPVGDVALRDPHGQRLRDRRFADAGFADETGVILLPAAQDLHDPLQLSVPSDDTVELALARAFGEIGGVLREEFRLAVVLFVGFFALFRFFARFVLVLGLSALVHELGEIEKRRAGLRVIRIVRIAHILHDAFHVGIEPFDGFVIEAGLREHIVDGLDAKLLRAFDAQAILLALAVFHSGEENDRHTFVASGTHHHLLCFLYLLRLCRLFTIWMDCASLICNRLVFYKEFCFALVVCFCFFNEEYLIALGIIR